MTTIPKIFENDNVFMSLKKLFSEHSILLKDEKIKDLYEKLDKQLNFLLSSCVKFKSGRIVIKGSIRYEIDLPGSFKNYTDFEKDYADYNHSCYHDVYLTRNPGLRYKGSRQDSCDFELLKCSNFLHNNDLWQVDDIGIINRTLHLNHLNELPDSKVIKERVEQFFKWFKLLKEFATSISDHNTSTSQMYYTRTPKYTLSQMIIAFGYHTVDEAELESLQIKLIKLADEKRRFLRIGYKLLDEINEVNKPYKVLFKLKGEAK